MSRTKAAPGPQICGAVGRAPGKLAAALLFLALAALLLPLGAQAAFEFSGEVIGRADDCACMWNRITLRNRTGRNVSYKIVYSSSGTVVYEGKPIEPDGERVLNLAVPLSFHGWPQIWASDGTKASINMKQQSAYGSYTRVLNISEIEHFASQKEIEDFSREYLKRSSNPSHYSGHSSSSSINPVAIQIEPANLPDNWLCYAPFHAVFIRASALERLSSAERTALTRWVDAGGCLAIYGAEKEEYKRQMLGTVSRMRQSPVHLSFEQIPEDWLRRRIQWQSQSDWKPSGYYSSSRRNVRDDQDFPFRQGDPQGRTGAFILATIFLFVAGPANYFYCRRKGRIRLLMLTLPAISGGFCLLIIAFFVATQGFTRIGGSVSVTLLDEDRDSAFTFSRHALYSGLYPLGGFRFDRETLFLPMCSASDFSIDATTHLHLKSGIFQATTNFHYLTAHPHVTREKLVYDRAAQTAINGFEKPIETLLVADGRTLLSARNVAPGAKAKLQRIENLAAAKTADGQAQDNEDQRRLQALGQLQAMSEKEFAFFERRMSDLASPKLNENSFSYYAVMREPQPAIMQPGLAFDKPGCLHLLLGWTGSSSSQTDPDKKKTPSLPLPGTENEPMI